jgi:hypothetical protein
MLAARLVPRESDISAVMRGLALLGLPRRSAFSDQAIGRSACRIGLSATQSLLRLRRRESPQRASPPGGLRNWGGPTEVVRLMATQCGSSHGPFDVEKDLEARGVRALGDLRAGCLRDTPAVLRFNLRRDFPTRRYIGTPGTRYLGRRNSVWS